MSVIAQPTTTDNWLLVAVRTIQSDCNIFFVETLHEQTHGAGDGITDDYNCKKLFVHLPRTSFSIACQNWVCKPDGNCHRLSSYSSCQGCIKVWFYLDKVLIILAWILISLFFCVVCRFFRENSVLIAHLLLVFVVHNQNESRRLPGCNDDGCDGFCYYDNCIDGSRWWVDTPFFLALRILQLTTSYSYSCIMTYGRVKYNNNIKGR